VENEEMSKLRDTLPPLDAPSGRSRWRQAERRAVADHERWVCQTLQRLAFIHTPLLAVGEGEERSGTAADAGVVSLTLPGRRLILAGVARGPRLALADAAGRGHLQLDAAGRYGRFWWIQVKGETGPGEKIVLLGSHLHLSPGSAGYRRRLDLQPQQGGR
jgi:hypothetical protein